MFQRATPPEALWHRDTVPKTAVMLVHSFSQSSRWREDFKAFAEAIGGKRVTDDLYEIELDESPRLIIGWCKGAEKYLSVELPSAL